MAAPRACAAMEPLAIIGFLLGLLHICCSDEVTLLDTASLDSLDWQSHIGGGGRGWIEATWNNDGDSYRIYTVCNIAAENVHNWLRTPFIPRGNANRVTIEITFTMRRCTKHPNPDSILQCKESFKLAYYGAASDFANEMMPTWDTDTYTELDVIAADNTFESAKDAIINTESREIPITSEGVYFAFYDTGACTSILSIRVFYDVCPELVANFAIFPNTSTHAERSRVIQKSGVCVDHAAIEQEPTYLCTGNGKWDVLNGGCKCMPGYQPDYTQHCIECQPGTYKWRTGSEACLDCPAYSEVLSHHAVECECVQGYYRSESDDKSQPCTRPPTRPVHQLKVNYVDQQMVNLTWNPPPPELGGRQDLRYRVECPKCGSHVSYIPGDKGLNTTTVIIRGLNPSTAYSVRVYVENGVSKQSDQARPSETINFTTEHSVPSKVTNLRLKSLGSHYMTIAWDPLSDSGKIQQYEVRYYLSVSAGNTSSVYTKDPNVTFKDFPRNVRYSFRVRGKTLKGWGEFSDSFGVDTSMTREKPQPDNPIGIIAGSAVAVVVCMIIVIVMVIIFLRRNHQACNEKNVSDCDTLQYSNVHCPHVLEPGHVINGGLTMPLFTPPGGFKTYIDPHTYEDPHQAVREFTKEIDASCITIESVIGGGEFGDVCKGKLRIPARGELVVAIKTLKAGASDKNRLDFLTEASIMGQFDDPNVIYLEGVVTKSNPIMIVTEYMENNSLDSFLRNNDGKFTVIQLVGMMRGIASGMRYLAEMGYVHRDLAARNILTNENLVCKVADFGLSREIESDDTDGAYTTKGGKIPVRWTAPEAIAYRKFTSASDVWSYGVVMWEVMSYGERPYWNWSNQDVIKAVEKDFRLPPPMDCPEATHQLMLDCWQKERSHRPKFTAIVKTLDKLIRAPELLRKIAKARPFQYLDSSTPDFVRYDSVEEWLTSIKMERYSDHFLQVGFTSMDQVSQITVKDLTTLGVMLVGHQKKIMNSVQTLRAQMAGAQVSEGFIV